MAAPAHAGELSRAQARAARRTYRRSLPALYRWRRVTLALLGVSAAVAALSVVGRDPVTWAQDRWYDLRGTTVAVPDVQGFMGPAPDGRLVETADVTDRNPATRWSRPWIAGTPAATGCRQAERGGFVELRWATPIRVRELQLSAGLADNAQNRDLQFRPKTIWISHATRGDRRCVGLPVADIPERQSLELDSEDEIARLRVSVGDAYPPTVQSEREPVSIRELVVRSRPQ